MNVFDELRELERRGERFDTIVLDPPAFAKNKASMPQGAVRLQGDQPARAEAARRPAASSITCSCSYNVERGDVRRRRSRRPSVDAHADVAVVEKRMQGRDHPVLIDVPETYYLKCFILRKLA